MEHITNAYLFAGGAVSLSDEDSKSEQEYYMYKIDDVVNILEDHEYEFKEIKGGSPKNAITSNVSEYATSFLNNQGGRILYGITNDRKVKGFTADADLIDKIKQGIYNSLREIQPPLSGNHYKIEFHPVYDSNSQVIENLYVLEVGIPPSRDRSAIYFDKGKDLHIRLDGVKHQLKGTEIISFIQGKLLEV
ncbi:MAG: ATP-binding protein [Bacillota bacterium]